MESSERIFFQDQNQVVVSVSIMEVWMENLKNEDMVYPHILPRHFVDILNQEMDSQIIFWQHEVKTIDASDSFKEAWSIAIHIVYYYF